MNTPDIELDLNVLLDKNCEVYCIKLSTGETILAKSSESTESMNEKGSMEVFGAMAFEAYDEMTDSGKVSRVQLLAPWIQGAAIDAILPIPLDMVIQVVPCKPSIKFQYNNVLMAQLVKDQVSEERFQIIKEEMERRQEDVAQKLTGNVEERMAVEPQPFYIEPVPEREADRISEAAELYSEQQESEEDNEPETEETKLYQVNGVTIH